MLQASRNVKDAMLFNILSYMSNELLTNGHTAASIDEFYLFLTNLTAVEYIRNFMKRVRKRTVQSSLPVRIWRTSTLTVSVNIQNRCSLSRHMPFYSMPVTSMPSFTSIPCSLRRVSIISSAIPNGECAFISVAMRDIT